MTNGSTLYQCKNNSQVQQLLGKVGEPRGGEGGTRKRCSGGGGGGPGGGISPLPGQLPSFQEEEVTLEEGRVRMVERQLSTSDPIPIKKVAMESSSDKISVSGSECQGKTNLSRSFEESRPRLPQSLKKSNHQKIPKQVIRDGYEHRHRSRTRFSTWQRFESSFSVFKSLSLRSCKR